MNRHSGPHPDRQRTCQGRNCTLGNGGRGAGWGGSATLLAGGGHASLSPTRCQGLVGVCCNVCPPNGHLQGSLPRVPARVLFCKCALGHVPTTRGANTPFCCFPRMNLPGRGAPPFQEPWAGRGPRRSGSREAAQGGRLAARRHRGQAGALSTRSRNTAPAPDGPRACPRAPGNVSSATKAV